jgi:hypothetical protein
MAAEMRERYEWFTFVKYPPPIPLGDGTGYNRGPQRGLRYSIFGRQI